MKLALTGLVLGLTTPLLALVGNVDDISSTGAQLSIDPPGGFAVCNRAEGTVSLFDARDDSLVTTFSLPAAANPAETMYPVWAPRLRRLFVGDRANDRIVAIDLDTLNAVGEVPTGAGVFHHWMDALEKQCWVVNDADATLTVFDPATLVVLATVPVPADLVQAGGFPHDVTVTPIGDAAFVSVFGLTGGDVIVRYDTGTFQESGRITVGGASPHMTLAASKGVLYAQVQGANAVEVYDLATLAPITSIAVPNAHGGGVGRGEKYLYAVNIAGGGPDAVHTIDTTTHTLVSSPGVDTSAATPHNVASSRNGRKLYLTHSDGGTQVTVLGVGATGVPAVLTQVDAGANPYGICAIF